MINMMIKFSQNIKLCIVFVTLLCSTKMASQDANVTINQDPILSNLLALKKEVNKTKPGYTIRVFRGQRNEAETALSAYKNDFPEWYFKLKQAYPSYEILLGNFATRLETERALIALKKKCSIVFKSRKRLRNMCLQSFIGSKSKS